MTTTLQIPLTLLREEMDGRLYYYKGYGQVLSGEKQPAEIMGSSELQSYLVGLILRRLFTMLPESEYLIQTGEPGLNIAPGDNLANDITIRRTKDSIIDRNATGYAKKPPLVVLEVDIKSRYGQWLRSRLRTYEYGETAGFRGRTGDLDFDGQPQNCSRYAA